MTQALVRPFVLIALAIGLLPLNGQFIVPRATTVSCAGAVVGDLTPGTLTLTSTLRSISVKAAYTGDGTADATAAVQFKPSSSSTWLDAYTPIIDRRTNIVGGPSLGTVSNAANVNQARGSIVGLTENTPYDVKIIWTDSGGASCVQGAVTTVTSTPITGGTSYYVNSATGADGNLGTSSGSPWATIAHALASTSAGDTINCNGTFAAFTITTSGTSGAYRKFQKEPGQTCTISAGSININLQGDYWWLDGITCAASTNECVLLSGTRQHVYVTGWTATDHNTGDNANQGAITVGSGSHDIFLLSNTFARTSASASDDRIDGIRFPGGNYSTIVVDGNTLSGTLWDAIGNGSNSSLTNFTNVDFSNNSLTNYRDDAIEMDGGGINLRVWGNLSTSAGGSFGGTAGGGTGLSEAGTIVGPSYVFRNYMDSSAGNGAVKGGHDAVGYAFFFHNTIVTSTVNGSCLTQAGGPAHSENHVYRNNIFKCTQQVYEDEGRPSSSYDYDVCFPTGAGGVAFHWNETATNYSTLANFQAGTSQEAHGVGTNPTLDGSYHIANTSVAYNVGLTLANFNDAPSAWPAQHGAPDIGAYEVP